MEYSFFKNLEKSFVGPIENIEGYKRLFKTTKIVPNEIIIQDMGRDALGERMLASCITTRGQILNFLVNNYYEEKEYRDYLAGVYYIYNEKYYFIRNVCYTDEGKLKCSVDFYDRETLNRIKQVIPQEKSFIEPTDYIKYNINPDLTYDITFEDYDLLMLDASDEDIICAISKISYDLKVRTKNSGWDLPFEI